jgi:hypothetical protein
LPALQGFFVTSQTYVPATPWPPTAYYNVSVTASNGTSVKGVLVRNGTASGGSLDSGFFSVLTALGPIINGELLTIPGDQIGGTSPADDAVLELTSGTPGGNTNNLAIGYCAAGENPGNDSFGNVFVGAYSGLTVGASGEFNHIFIGSSAGSYAFGGFYNTYIGAYAGKCAGGNDSFSNIFIGTYAGMYAGNSFYQTIVGAYAGMNLVNPNGWVGVGNQLFGAFSGESLTTSYGNSFFGAYSGDVSTTGIYNSFFGLMAGGSNTTGSFNSFFGSCSGGTVGGTAWSTTGSRNTAFGSKTNAFLACNSSGNTSLGYKAGEGVFGGLGSLGWSGGTAIPSEAYNSYCLPANCFLDPTWPYNNNREGDGAFVKIVRDGSGAICELTVIDPGFYQNSNSFACVPGSLIGGVDGVDNLPITGGVIFCTNNSVQSNNTFLGAYAGQASQNGTRNFYGGFRAGAWGIDDSDTIAIGSYAGFCSGYHSGPLPSWLTGVNNIYLGYKSGYGGGGYSNFFAGRYSGFNSLGAYASGNIGVGSYVGCSLTDGYGNVMLGGYAGLGTTTGSANVFLGYSAGTNNVTGTENVFIGKNSGRYNQAGCQNIFIGGGSGYSSTGGCLNIGIGLFAGSDLTTGIENIQIGKFSGGTTTGCYNIYQGNSAGSFNTTGSYNVYLGKQAGGGSGGSTASYNVYIGRTAGIFTTSGSCNTYLGCDAGAWTSTGSNNIALGNKAGVSGVFFLTTESNRIIVGNDDHTNAYIKVGWTVTSDERDKTCVSAVRHGLDFVNEITPVQFNWKDRETGKVTDETPRYGFLAQEILAAEGDPAILVDNNDPENLKLRESMMTPVLVKAIQELCQKVETLEARIQTLENPTL